MEIYNISKGDNKRKLLVKDIAEEHIVKNDQVSKKVKLITYDEITKQTFYITDAWVQDSKGNIRIQGMWLSNINENEIIPTCTLAKVMDYYKVKTLGDLINNYIYAYPDKNNYLVILACDLN